MFVPLCELISYIFVLLFEENVFSESPLHAACTGGKSWELVAYLLKQPGVDVNQQGADGHTALHSAALHGHIHVVQVMFRFWFVSTTTRYCWFSGSSTNFELKALN